MRRLRWISVILALLLTLSLKTEAVDSLHFDRMGLEGRTFLVLADSYTAGYGVPLEKSWPGLMAERYGMTELNYAVSGSTISHGTDSFEPMVDRAEDLPEDVSPDFVLIQGGSNDFFLGVPLGTPGDTDPGTFCGAVNRVISTLEDKYPGALLVGFTPWVGNSNRTLEGHTQQDYTDAMIEVFRRRGHLCYDASDEAASGIRVTEADFRADYCLGPGDWYHLGEAGHALFAPVIAGWLENHLYNSSPASRFYDLAGADPELRDAVSALMEEAVLSGTGDHLFSPTRAVSRATLAVTLYRMAGYPEAPERDIADMTPDTEACDAVCWAMDQGLFSPEDSFRPGRTVSRQILALVLYSYYTDWYGGFPEALEGLGSYPDGAEVSGYARTAMGWAVSQDLIPPREGKLSPNSAVSRGQLALALCKLGRMTGD